jgi:hypothetical protein
MCSAQLIYKMSLLYSPGKTGPGKPSVSRGVQDAYGVCMEHLDNFPCTCTKITDLVILNVSDACMDTYSFKTHEI